MRTKAEVIEDFADIYKVTIELQALVHRLKRIKGLALLDDLALRLTSLAGTLDTIHERSREPRRIQQDSRVRDTA